MKVRHKLGDPPYVCFGARHFCLCTVCLCVCVFCPEPVEQEAQDVSVRVMSPQSVLVSWVDPVRETGKVDPQVARWESEEACVCGRKENTKQRRSVVFKQFPFFPPNTDRTPSGTGKRESLLGGSTRTATRGGC